MEQESELRNTTIWTAPEVAPVRTSHRTGLRRVGETSAGVDT